MLLLGKNIRSRDPLKSLDIKDLYYSVLEDRYMLSHFTQRMRRLRAINQEAYRHQKVKLPFFCISQFEGDVRHSRGFLASHYLLFDFDGLDSKQLSMARDSISRDPLTHLAYTSASNCGLKVVLRIDQKINELNKYKIVCRKALREFANRHNLEKYADWTATDATRASFIVPDENCIFNEQSEQYKVGSPDSSTNKELVHPEVKEQKLGAEALSDQSNPSKSHHKEEITEISSPQAEQKQGEPDTEAYEAIKAKLSASKRNQNSTSAQIDQEVPAHFQDIFSKLKKDAAREGLEASIAKPIQYGVQLKLSSEIHIGEANLYHGKRGYRVVPSMKASTHSDLNAILKSLLEIILDDQENLNNNAQPLRKT